MVEMDRRERACVRKRGEVVGLIARVRHSTKNKSGGCARWLAVWVFDLFLRGVQGVW